MAAFDNLAKRGVYCIGEEKEGLRLGLLVASPPVGQM